MTSDKVKDQQKSSTAHRPPAWRGWAVFVLAAAVAFGLGVLGASVMQRREEARVQPPLEPIDKFETDSSRWAGNYPREYDRYKMMEQGADQTKYGGAAQRDYLKETPASVILFAGYPFSIEYRQARGHIHAVEDVSKTARISEKSPATCWTCKSPDVPRLMAAGSPAEFYARSFASLKYDIAHPIGCLDCHDPQTMRLRITRPALREAFERQGKNVDQVSHQEMRSLVCAQCHVEYYIKPKTNYLAFPWDHGTRIEEIEKYYDEPKFDGKPFADWTHAISKTPMIKIQHPDYEVYTTGIHAYRNVACADCHMPYRSEGGVKFTDHWVQSPLLNIANSCAVCHRWSEKEIRDRVEAIQDKVRESRGRAETTLSRAHLDVAACMQAGAADDELAEVRKLVRAAQLRWDFVAANNGMGFHSPQECLRILGAAIDLAGECRVQCARILAKHGVTDPVQYPDTSSKERAQAVAKAFVDGHPPTLVVKRP